MRINQQLTDKNICKQKQVIMQQIRLYINQKKIKKYLLIFYNQFQYLYIGVKIRKIRQDKNIIKQKKTVNMSKKICFSSVLKQKRNSYSKQILGLSLADMVQEFLIKPDGDYILRYSQNNCIKSNNSKQDFQQGYNPLDQWMFNQIQNNKQNIVDFIPKKQIPNQLLRYINTNNKSPIKNNLTKNDFNGLQILPTQKNMDMKQMCRQYAENKKNGSNGNKDGLVWKFSSKQEEDEDDNNFRETINNKLMRETEFVRESITAEKFKEESRLDQRENEILQQQFSRLKRQKINTAMKTLPQKESKGENLSVFIEQIKNNLAHEIEAMAQRIIQDRKNLDQDEQVMLISQRQNQQQKRFQKARKQIVEYLSMKKQVNDIDKKQEIDFKNCNKKKKNRQSLQQPIQTQTPKEKMVLSQHQHVSYSFASDFNGTPDQNQDHTAKKQPTQIVKPPPPQIQCIPPPKTQKSLANIDQVKSQQGDNQKNIQDFVEDSVLINIKKKIKEEQLIQIDKNFIKQIQSVAYTQLNTQQIIFNNIPTIRYQSQNNQLYIKKQNNSNQKDINNKNIQIYKNQFIIEQQHDNNQVNISIGKKNQHNSNQKNQQKKDDQDNLGNVGKVEENKVGSPEKKEIVKEWENNSNNQKQRSKEKEQPTPTVTPTPQTVLQTTQTSIPSSNYPQQPSTTVPSTSTHKTSFTSVIYTNASKTPTPTPQPTPSPPIAIKSSLTQCNTKPATAANQQSIKQVNSSLNNSNSKQQQVNKESRKLKITLSPKYITDSVQARQDSIPPITDFKTGTIKQKQPTPAETIPIPKQSIQVTNPNIAQKTSFNLTLATQNNLTNTPITSSINKLKVDDLLGNIGTLPNNQIKQNKQCKQSLKKSIQHALIRVEKYQKGLDKVVETTKSNHNSIKNNQSIKSSQQFEFNLDF